MTLLERLEKSIKRHFKEWKACLMREGSCLSLLIRGNEYVLEPGYDDVDAAFIRDEFRQAIIDAGYWPVETPDAVMLFKSRGHFETWLLNPDKTGAPELFEQDDRTTRWGECLLAVYPEEA